MDLGACPKSHTDRLKTDYTAAREKNPSDPRFQQFQQEYENNIFAFVDECDRRIKAAHRRLEKTPEENAKTTNLMREIGEIEIAIQGGTEKIEQLGEQGLVDESMKELQAVEALKVEKSEKEVSGPLVNGWAGFLTCRVIAGTPKPHGDIGSVGASEITRL
jgi:seryl-tRNA synthetase